MKDKKNKTEQPESTKSTLFDRESRRGWIIAGTVLILLAAFLVWLLAFPHSREYTHFSKRLTRKIETRFSVTITDDITLTRYSVSKDDPDFWVYSLYLDGVDDPEGFMEKNIHGDVTEQEQTRDGVTAYSYSIEYDSDVHYSDTTASVTFSPDGSGNYKTVITILD